MLKRLHHFRIKKSLISPQKQPGLVIFGAFLAFFSLAMTGCNGERTNELPSSGSQDSLDIALKNSAERAIVPGFETFNQQVSLLQTHTQTFCETTAKDASQLQQLQTDWRTLSLLWNRVALFNFGPLNDDLVFPRIHRIESYRQRGNDYSASIRNDLNSFMSATSPNLDFSQKTFQYVGLLPLEIALFENSDTQAQNLEAILADYQQKPAKCVYVQALLTDLAAQTQTVLKAWQTTYLNAFINNQADDDDTPAINLLITTVQAHLDYLKRRKLDGTLDAQLSNQPYEQILAGLEAVEALLRSTEKDADYRIFDHMRRNGDTQAVETVQQNLADAKQAAIAQNRSELSVLMGLLDGNFKREIPNGLAVTLGINFSDGD